LRHTSQFNKHPQPIKAHNVHSGGVTALCFSKSRSTVYTAGGDGSFMAWTVGGKANPNQPIPMNDSLSPELSNMREVERVPGSQIRLFKEILLESFVAQQENARANYRQAVMQDLMKIKEGLMTLLAENDRVTDIERLERDEFVIDVNRSVEVHDEGEKECEDIRKEAEKTVLRLQLLRKRV
jgi:hypothetical protein